MKKIVNIVLIALIFCSCKSKESGPEKNFISVHSFFQNQVADVDTSLYPIVRLDIVDSTTDTSYIRREDFRAEAVDFLNLPDISLKQYSKNYTEQNRVDETINRVIITYLPIDPTKNVIQKQELLIAASPGNDKVTSIYIDYLKSDRDSVVQKRMLWQIDRSFQVTTIRQVAGQPETIATKKVIWNEPENP